ncbi:MAG: hypothetical protein EU536_03800 [Promethearchaeota archaeon]|nr:MAG: hypothetical protein EU536_03800 [Candidatus Lokiarchaeota archaeon]
MQNKKLCYNWLILIFLIVPLIFLPSCNAQEVNIWGTSEGTVKVYWYRTIYSGSINNIADYGDYTYTIINIWDNDDNNCTELLYARERLLLGNPSMDLITLNDDAGGWDYTDLLLVISGGDIRPLCPIIYDDVHNGGMNWTAEIEYINTLTNYTASVIGNTLSIHSWESGTSGEVYYTEDTYIKWDMATGWLISYENSIDYGDPNNYQERILITRGSGSAGIDLSVILGIIGVICGGIGIAFAFWIWRKKK